MLTHPPPSKLVASGETVLHTLRPGVAKSAFPQFEQAFCCGGHRLSTTFPWLHLGHGPFFPQWAGAQYDPYTRSTRQTRSTHLDSQANPNSRSFSEPVQAVCPRVICSSDFVELHLDVRRQAAPRGLALPGLACEVSLGTGLSAVRTPGVPSCHCAACAANWQAMTD